MTRKLYTIIECQTDDLQHVCQQVLYNSWDLNKARKFYERYQLVFRNLSGYRVIDNSTTEMEIYSEFSKINTKIQLIEMEVQ